jgi:hypothetical protein
MNSDLRFHHAAMRVLEGDESREAAGLLEAVVLDDYPGDERFDELLYVLSLYSPGAGAPYCDAEELRDAVRRALADLGDPAGSG